MTVLASDSFNRSNSTTALGTTDSYAGGAAYTWSSVGSAVWGISSNQAYTPTSANDSPTVIDIGQSDNVQIQVDLAVTSSIYPTGLAFRVGSSTNYFRCYATTSNVKIDRMLNGTITNIVNQNFTAVTTPFTLAVTLSGSIITVFINGTQVASVTDSNLTTNTKHGMYIGNGTTLRLDNFQISSTSSGTTVTASASGGSVSGGNSTASETLSASASGGSISGGTSAGSSTLVAIVIGGSQTGGSSSSSSTLVSTVSGGSNSGGSSTSTTGTIIQVNVSGGSTSNGKVASVTYQQTTSADGGSTSNGQSVGVIFMSVGANGGSITGGQAFANLLQQAAFISGGSTSGGATIGGAGASIVERIKLNGQRILHVSLSGSRQLRVTLGGSVVTQTNQNFTMYVGETKFVDISATNQDGTAMNLTGATVKWVLKKYVSSATNDVYKDTTNGGISISGSTFTVNLLPTDTQNLAPGPYYHEAKVTDALGEVSVVTTGTCTINPSGA